MPAKKVAKKKAAPKKVAKKKAAPKKVAKVKETFELLAPDAARVLLAGDFTQWEEDAKKMKRLKSGMWKIQIPLESERTVQYRFLVDGSWVDDPECQTRIPNGLGGENCIRQVGA